MKIFWSVLGALVAFAVLSSIVGFIYLDRVQSAKIEKCVEYTNGVLIGKGDYKTPNDMKSEIYKECAIKVASEY